MKRKFNYIVSTIVLSVMLYACNMTEEPTFLASDNLFNDVVGANTVLNGVYSSVASYNYYSSDYHHLLNMSSGLFSSNHAGSMLGIAALNPPANLNFVVNLWKGAFQAISRANNLIEGLTDAEMEDATEKNNILGQAYFIRSLSYFNLVRVYGKCPLITSSVESTNPYYPMSSAEAIYEQVIADAKMAEQLLPDAGKNTPGRPAKYAANMLLAKVYMQLAGNKKASETDNWQKAYDEAIKAYGKYALVHDYSTLWYPETSDNTSESIFEIQGNVEYTIRLTQLWTASNGHVGQATWGRFKPNLEVYDRHAARYPNDPRMKFTFVTEWYKFASNGTSTLQVTYPTFKSRNNQDKSYPYHFKYFMKDTSNPSYNTEQNYVIFRYADLLLMLAEIENELNGSKNACKYVNEVLARARVAGGASSAIPANWSEMTQDTFRANIMFEYMFELLGEGHDWFNVRRRGYDWFKTNVIDAHNNHKLYNFTVARDVRYPDNERIMVMPIPDVELTANPNMSAADQNPGY